MQAKGEMMAFASKKIRQLLGRIRD